MAPLSDFLSPIVVMTAPVGTNTSALVTVSLLNTTVYKAVLPVPETTQEDSPAQLSISPLFLLLKQIMDAQQAQYATLTITTVLCTYGLKDGSTPTYGETDNSEYAYLLDTTTRTIDTYDILYYDPIRAGKAFPYDLTLQALTLFPLHTQPLFVPQCLVNSIVETCTPVVQITLYNGNYRPLYRNSNAAEQTTFKNAAISPQADFTLFEYYNEFGTRSFLALPGTVTEKTDLETETAVLANAFNQTRIKANTSRTFTFKSSPLPASLLQQANLLMTSPKVRIVQLPDTAIEATIGACTFTEILITDIKAEHTPYETAESPTVEFTYTQVI